MDERWAIEIHFGNGQVGGRTHIITLASREAVDKFIENASYIADAFLTDADMLEFEESDYDLV